MNSDYSIHIYLIFKQYGGDYLNIYKGIGIYGYYWMHMYGYYDSQTYYSGSEFLIFKWYSSSAYTDYGFKLRISRVG